MNQNVNFLVLPEKPQEKERIALKTTLKEIARNLNISEAAVSLALNDRVGVSEETRKKVKMMARHMGYQKSEATQGLTYKHSHRIGLIVPEIENPFYSRMISCVEMALKERKYQMELAISSESQDTERRAIRELAARQAAGILISPLNQLVTDFAGFDSLQERNIPALFLASYYPELPYPCIMTDLKLGTYQLFQYLFRQGRRKIRILTGPVELPAFKLRMDGAKKAFAEEGAEWDDDALIQCRGVSFAQAYYATHALLDMREPFDTLVAVNDYMALGALKALRERGIRVPEEVAVAGYDDILYAAVSTPGITTVSQDIQQMCELGVDRLVRMVERRIMPRRETAILKPKLIVRDSAVCRKMDR